MSYRLATAIILNPTDTGLTLSGQLLNTDGSNNGSLITTGFFEAGLGMYGFYNAALTSGFQGFLKVLSGSTLVAFMAINPAEAESWNNIPITDPGAATNMTTLDKLLIALWRRNYKKTSLDSNNLKTYADDNTTVNTTQPVSDNGTIQIVDHA